MAFTLISVTAYNHRARMWQCTGDGASTSLTVPNDGTLKRPLSGGGTGTSFATDTATAFGPSSGRGGLYAPTAGTAQTVSSTTVNADGTLTVVFSSAPTNAHVITGVTVFDQSDAEI